MKKFLLLLLLPFLYSCQPSPSQNLSSPNSSIKVEQVKYIKNIDGDTITVLYQGVTTNVRLIGVDTPESKRNAKAKSDALKQKKTVDQIVAQGKISSKFTASLFQKNNDVFLEFDKTKKDKYGRLLAYVYTNSKMVNETIILEGYAYPMTIKPNVKYAKQFAGEYQQAVKDKKGLWK